MPQQDLKDFYVIERDKAMYDSNWKKPAGHFGKDKVTVVIKSVDDAKKNAVGGKVAIKIQCPVSVISRYYDQQAENWIAVEDSDEKKLEKYDDPEIRSYELKLYDTVQNPGFKPELMAEGLKLIEGHALSVDEFSKLFT